MFKIGFSLNPKTLKDLYASKESDKKRKELSEKCIAVKFIENFNNVKDFIVAEVWVSEDGEITVFKKS